MLGRVAGSPPSSPLPARRMCGPVIPERFLPSRWTNLKGPGRCGRGDPGQAGGGGARARPGAGYFSRSWGLWVPQEGLWTSPGLRTLRLTCRSATGEPGWPKGFSCWYWNPCEVGRGGRGAGKRGPKLSAANGREGRWVGRPRGQRDSWVQRGNSCCSSRRAFPSDSGRRPSQKSGRQEGEFGGDGRETPPRSSSGASRLDRPPLSRDHSARARAPEEPRVPRAALGAQAACGAPGRGCLQATRPEWGPWGRGPAPAFALVSAGDAPQPHGLGRTLPGPGQRRAADFGRREFSARLPLRPRLSKAPTVPSTFSRRGLLCPRRIRFSKPLPG